MTKAVDLLCKFLEARDVIHTQHLRTTSYAEHKALGEFYDKWLEHTDDFIETYMGIYGRIFGDFKIVVPAEVKTDMYLMQLRAFLQMDAKEVYASGVDCDLDNIIADMMGLINHTLYMITLQ